MAKHKITLWYDDELKQILDDTGCSLCCWDFFDNIPVTEEAVVQANPLDKLTQLRAMNLSVDEIRDLKDIGII